VRWIWAAALALTVILSASARFRGVRPLDLPAANAAATTAGGPPMQKHASWRGTLLARADLVRHSIDAPLRAAVAAVNRALSPAANVYAGSFASAATLGLALVLVGVGRRFRRARGTWPVVALGGVDVRVAPRIGPVVIGLLRPEIVVPRWLLTRNADEQRMVVTHENEHVRARDPLLLGIAWAAVIAAPWNPAVWYMLSRLRLAVELDCDARVLRRGTAPRLYGALLIDVAQHASGLQLSALALADDSSHLHQRILAMKPTTPRFARLRAGLAASLALCGVLAACEATLPTDSDVEHMDVANVTKIARALAQARHADTTVNYTINGAAATLAEAKARAGTELSDVQFVIVPDGNPTQINLKTRKAVNDKVLAHVVADGADSVRVRRRASMDGMDGEWKTPVAALVGAPVAMKSPSKTAFTGLIFIDGVRSTESQMRSLGPTQIESVEVLKGAAAAQEYGTDAAKGVIVIKTKRGGGAQ
ncbi:MAG TPA: M56 family metallopeptidase, partial [Gemmatimonadaceae bacterium]